MTNPAREFLSGPTNRLSIKRLAYGFSAACMGSGIVFLCLGLAGPQVDVPNALWPLCVSLAGMCGYGYVNGQMVSLKGKDKPPDRETVD